MKTQLTMKLRLVWLPAEMRGTRRGFELVAQSASVTQGRCAVLDMWHKYATPPDICGLETVIFTDMDEPAPLPAETQFVLMVTHDDGEPGATQEAFYDWQALDEDSARLFCHQEFGEALETLAHKAHKLIELPVAGPSH